MELHKIKDFTKGWFIGDFEPSLEKTESVEVAVKYYNRGDCEEMHFHKIATEFTVIVQGQVRMNKNVYSAGDIVVVKPGEAVSFEALTSAINVVVKLPGAKSDKYKSQGSEYLKE